MKMKISKKEKYLVLALGAVIIGVAYYYLLFTPQSEKLSLRKSEKTTLQNEYDLKNDRIKKLGVITTKNKESYADLCQKTSGYYPLVMQEKIIIEIDKFMQDSGVKGNLSFKEKTVTSVEKIGAPFLNKSNGILGGIADSINENTREKTYSEPEIGNSIGDCEQLIVSLKYRETSYESLSKLITALEKYERTITINELSAVLDTGKLNGTITLEFYGLAKLDEATDVYLKWTIANLYGKKELFSAGAATGINVSSVKAQATSDFSMILRAPSSVLPSLTMGKTKDDSTDSNIYSDVTSIEDVTVEFQEENGQLYYKYRTASEFYPKGDTGLGQKFTPVSGNIIFDILSERRLGDSDTSIINLKIINNTSKSVKVLVTNDDETKPRVKVSSEGKSATTVTEK